MSFDLAVFDPDVAPKTADEFLRWYQQQTEWSHDIDYMNPANASPALHDWLRALIGHFSPLNGPYAAPDPESDDFADEDDGEGHWCDYSAAESFIYVSFGWPSADSAFETSARLAAEHGVGLFACSESPSRVFIPDGSGGLTESLTVS